MAITQSTQPLIEVSLSDGNIFQGADHGDLQEFINDRVDVFHGRGAPVTSVDTKNSFSVSRSCRGSLVRNALRATGNGKRECRAWPIMVLRPETTSMSLDNRAAHRQPDTHTAALGRVKGIEGFVHVLTAEANAGIPYGQAHAAVALAVGPDQQLSRAILNIGHGVRGVSEQIQDDLLELNTIPGHQRRAIGELRLHDHPVSLKIVQ